MFRTIFYFAFLLSFSCGAEIVISDAKVRLLPPGVPNTSAYFNIENTSASDLVLISGKADFAKTVELHNHIMKGEVMRMVKQEQVKVPAGESIRFQPGGLHLMLFGLKSALSEGQKVNLSLVQQDGSEIKFEATVVMPGQESQHSHHHH